MDYKPYSDLFLNQTKDLIWLVDQNLNLLSANKAYLNFMKEVTGEEKSLNTPVLIENYDEDYMEKWRAYYHRALSGEDFTLEERFFHPKKEKIYYTLISFSPIIGKKGNIKNVVCRSTDVTNIVKERYRATSLLDASLDVFCTINEAGHFVYVSAASAKHWGYSPDELIGKPFRDLIIEEDLEKTDIAATEIREGRNLKSFQNRYQKRNGGIAYNLWSARWDDEAKLMYCVARDNAEKIEEERQSKLLSSVITNTNDAVLITEAEPLDEPGPRIIYVNDAFTKMTGYTAEEVIGKTPRILQGPRSDFEELAKLGTALQNWVPYEVTTINYKKSGEEFWVNFKIAPVKDETGSYTHWISVQRDVTDQKNAELEKTLLAQISSSFLKPDLNHVSTELCNLIQDFTDAVLVELWCPNLEESLLSRVAFASKLNKFKKKKGALATVAKGQGLRGHVWEKGQQLFWDREKILKNTKMDEEAEDSGLESLLGVPLTHQTQLVGVLVIGFSKSDANLQKFSNLLKNLETFIGSEIHRKKLEEDLKNLYETIPEILCISDLSGRYLKMNPAGCSLLGYEESEIIHKHFEEFVHPEDKTKSYEVLSRLQAGKKTKNFENRVVTKDGQIIWLSWTSHSSIEDGLVYAAAKNITEEKELWRLNKQAFKLSKVGSWEYDMITGELYWSDEVFDLHDMEPGAIVPNVETAINYYKEEHKAYVAGVISKSLTDEVPLDYEAIIISIKNKEKWVRVLGTPEFFEGKCVKFIGSFQDITKQKNTEEKIKLISERLQVATQAAGVGIWDWDISQNKLIWDEKMYELFDVNPFEFEGAYEAWAATVHPDDLNQANLDVENAINGGSEFDSSFRIIWKDKSIHHIKANALIERDLDGKAVRMVGTNWDITKMKESEKKLSDLNESLQNYAQDIEAQNKKLRNIAWTQSHVVRAPLAKILGIINLLELEKENYDNLMYWLSQLKVSAQEMDEIVKKITEEAQEIQSNQANE